MEIVRKHNRNKFFKTYQTISYHDHDDGYNEFGIAHNYKVMSTGDQSGTTAIVINGKTHNLSNNCVRDNAILRNGKPVVWARYVPLADIGPDNNGRLLWYDVTNAEDVWSLRNQANANALGGFTNWDIPNMNELHSIIDWSSTYPAINTTVFPSTPSSEIWTSTTIQNQTTVAWYIRFTTGVSSGSNKTTEKAYCRLIRN